VNWIRLTQAFSCEHSNEPSCPIKDRKFLEKLNDYHILKNNFFHGVSLA
jgi:hypothetical protein